MTVTREDIESKLAELQETLDEQTEGAKSRLMPAAIVGVVLFILLAYVLGRRRGKKQTTIVEIRRL